MKIIKYQYLKNNKYKIVLDNDDFKDITLYEDIIIKNNILVKGELTKSEVLNYLKENNYYDNYYKAIKYIKIRLRSTKEIEIFLTKQKCEESSIKKIIEQLHHQGYLNDNIFAKCYIEDSINMKCSGPYKIKQELLKLGIDELVINKELLLYNKNLQQEKIRKYITKQTNINRNKSLYMLKQKILFNLINMGFYKEDILPNLDNIILDEEGIYNKEYQKAYNKLKLKYSGYELEKRIKQKLYQKGLYK